jgi:hypothetical protein
MARGKCFIRLPSAVWSGQALAPVGGSGAAREEEKTQQSQDHRTGNALFTRPILTVRFCIGLRFQNGQNIRKDRFQVKSKLITDPQIPKHMNIMILN